MAVVLRMGPGYGHDPGCRIFAGAKAFGQADHILPGNIPGPVFFSRLLGLIMHHAGVACGKRAGRTMGNDLLQPFIRQPSVPMLTDKHAVGEFFEDFYSQ